MLNLFFRKSEDNMFEDFRLKVFMAVAETGSFTKAAKSIGISQPAVSQNINALEKEIGTPLILRAKGEASLTSAGAVFLEYASRILYWYNATSEMFGENGRMTGGKPVRIAADHVVASYLLPDALARIAGSHPEFSFEVKHIDPAITRATTNCDVPGTHFGTPEDADVEISVAPSPETMDFEGERKLVGVMEAMVIASPQNRSVINAAVSEEDNAFTVKPFPPLPAYRSPTDSRSGAVIPDSFRLIYRHVRRLSQIPLKPSSPWSPTPWHWSALFLQCP